MSKIQIDTQQLQSIFKQNTQIKLVDLIFLYFKKKIPLNTIREILYQLQNLNKLQQEKQSKAKIQWMNQIDSVRAQQLFVEDIIDLIKNFQEFYQENTQQLKSNTHQQKQQKQNQQKEQSKAQKQPLKNLEMELFQKNKLQNELSKEKISHQHAPKKQSYNKSSQNKILNSSNKIQQKVYKSKLQSSRKQKQLFDLKKVEVKQTIQQVKQQKVEVQKQYKKINKNQKTNKLQVSKNQQKLVKLQTSRISVKQRLVKPIRQPKKLILNKSFQTVKQFSFLQQQHSKQFLTQWNKLKKILIAAFYAYVLEPLYTLEKNDPVSNQKNRMNLRIYLKFCQDFGIKNLLPINQINRLFKVVTVHKMQLYLETFILINFKIIQIKAVQNLDQKKVEIARQQEMIQRAKIFLSLFTEQKLKKHFKILNKQQLQKIIEQYNSIKHTQSKQQGNKIQIIVDYVNRNYHQELKKYQSGKQVDMQSFSKLRNKTLTSKSKSKFKRQQVKITQNIKYFKTQSQKTISELKEMMSLQDISPGQILSSFYKKRTLLLTNNMEKNNNISKNESSLPKIQLANKSFGRSKSQANINKAKKSLNTNNQSLPSVSQNRNPSRNDSKQNLLLKLKLQQNRNRNLSYTKRGYEKLFLSKQGLIQFHKIS